jgi:hypothetical protein
MTAAADCLSPAMPPPLYAPLCCMLLPRGSGEVDRRDFRDGFDAKIVMGRRGTSALDSASLSASDAAPSPPIPE